MEPTIASGERVRLELLVAEPQRGDVVAFRSPRDQSRAFVMRVVGLPGETVKLVGGQLHIDGDPVAEPYLAGANRTVETSPTWTVPAGEYFVMGDNRRASADSRAWGTVPTELIYGRVRQR